MDLRRRRSKFTREQRLAIIEEYENGTLTGAEIAQKYGFKSPSLIFNWRERLLNPQPHLRKPKKVVPLQPKSCLKWQIRSR